jgi:hypothetical protein
VHTCLSFDYSHGYANLNGACCACSYDEAALCLKECKSIVSLAGPCAYWLGVLHSKQGIEIDKRSFGFVFFLFM